MQSPFDQPTEYLSSLHSQQLYQHNPTTYHHYHPLLHKIPQLFLFLLMLFSQGRYPHLPAPPKKPQKTKGCLIGCGTFLLLIFVIGSCNAIIGASNTASVVSTSVVATMPPLKAKITSLPLSKPTQSPTQPTIEHPTPTLVPTQPPVQPTQPPVQPTQLPIACQGVNGNPWCFNFNSVGGTVITSPPAAFCSG